jgi:hypothetical protein
MKRPGLGKLVGVGLAAVILVAVSAMPAAGSSGGSGGCSVGAKTISFGSRTTYTIGPTSSYSQVICLQGNTGGSTPLFDVKAVRTSGSSDFFLCLNGIPDASNPSNTSYARSSHFPKSGTQRAGMLLPRYREYEVDIGASGAVVAGCGFNPLASPATFSITISYVKSSNGGFSHGFAFTNLQLPAANPSVSQPGSGEPSIAVDRLHGNRTYISGPVGVPSALGCAFNGTTQGCNGVNFWWSTNAGSSFTFCNASDPNGGGDSHVAVDSTGSIYSADLAATDVDTQKLASTASGPQLPGSGADCGFTNTSPTAAASDRQWLATYLADPSLGTSAAKVYLSYHDLTVENVWECESADGGVTYGACVSMITDPTVSADAQGNTINGNQVFDSSGTIYSIFGTSTAPDNAATGGTGPIHNLYVAKSSDGINFTDYPVVITQTPGTASANIDQSQSLGNIFPVIATDGTNLYAVWSQMAAGGGPATVMFSSSTNRGVTWSKPVAVSSGLKSSVLPWIAAGSPGKVDIIWVGSANASSPMDVTGNWSIYMAQSLNATSSTPTLTQTLVSTQPVRLGWVCTNGILCTEAGDDGRILLDFISVAIDSNGMANIAYGDAGPDSEGYNAISGAFPYTHYAKQTQGTSVS